MISAIKLAGNNDSVACDGILQIGPILTRNEVKRKFHC